MKLRSEVTSQKLRGGYYTPASLVSFCWSRAIALSGKRPLRVLEPSAGAGGFFSAAPNTVLGRLARVVAIEVDPREAATCRDALIDLGIRHEVHTGSFIDWALNDSREFDIAIGNPPFLRFQFISEADRAAIGMLGLQLGIRIEGVANLWMPVLLGALAKLARGAVAAFVVPAELFTGMSARTVRTWIVENLSDVTVDLFPTGRFPEVLQEVVVISGRRERSGDRRLRVVRHGETGTAKSWTLSVDAEGHNWMGAYLEPEQLAVLDSVCESPSVVHLGDAAKLQVSIVTGANDFFCATDDEVREFDLARWARPLLPRIRHAPGVVWTQDDYGHLSDQTRKWLIHFSAESRSPLDFTGARRFLALGESRGIPKRYKCAVRDPWYRVPDVWAGELLLSKRSHRFPRLVMNDAKSLTTDTIYRGRMTSTFEGRSADLVSAFHNSLTALSAELEGRSFGGGVHELVPSEIGRLRVPLASGLSKYLGDLDSIARAAASPDDLIDATDAFLVNAGIISRSDMDVLAGARHVLMSKRLARGELTGDVSDHRELVAV